MKLTRVAISGIGVISALGSSSKEFWNSLETGRSAIQPIEALDVSGLRFNVGAEVRGYRPETEFAPDDLFFLDRFSQFALHAAEEAISQAGIEWTSALREEAAVVTGSCLGGKGLEEAGYREIFREGRNRVHPLTIPMCMSNAAGSHIAMRYGFRGPAYNVSTACASSSHAIGQAFWMVRAGIASMAIAGGSEAPFVFGVLKAWEAMRIISKDTCRPFSADRSGTVLGEGAAMLILEPLERVLSRGVQPIAEIAGFGMSSDACHITNPSKDGAAHAMRSALDDGGLSPQQIGYINAHGTATKENDRTEAAAIRAVFGGHADRLAISSTKSMHGHALGATGAIEAAGAILAIRNGILPPTANFSAPDPECDLDVIPNQARPKHVEACLSNSFAFGGMNAVLAFRALDD
jgi:nodulation protein E